MQNVWLKIKTRLTKGKTPSTMGYIEGVGVAIDIFSVLMEDLKDSKKELAAYNEDKEATGILLARLSNCGLGELLGKGR